MEFEEKSSEPISNGDGALMVSGTMGSISPNLKKAQLLKPGRKVAPASIQSLDHAIWQGDVLPFLKGLPSTPTFDLIVTSPPYNIGKEYETRKVLDEYVKWQESIIDELVPRLKVGGSLCWQVGNYVDDNQIFPLDMEFVLAPVEN